MYVGYGKKNPLIKGMVGVIVISVWDAVLVVLTEYLRMRSMSQSSNV